MTPNEILEIRFFCDDLGYKLTIREWLCELLLRLWDKGEGFSGKRPFGNSGWEWDVVPALIEAGVITGKIDDDGYVDECDEKALQDCIDAAIKCLASAARQQERK